MKVVCGIDGSAASYEAVGQVSSLLAPERDELIFYYSPPVVRLPRGTTPAAEVLNTARAKLAEAVFAKGLEALAADWRPRVRTILGSRAAREGLVLAAEQERADLVVVGARGLRGLNAMLLGSVSMAVVRQSSLPVFVARSRRAPAAPWQILVAYDEQIAGGDVRTLVSQFSWPAESVGRLAHVIEPLTVGEIPEWVAEKMPTSTWDLSRDWIAQHEAEKSANDARLRTAQEAFPPAFQSAAPLAVEGVAAEKILELVNKHKIDLVVLGTRKLGTMERFFLGSTSEHVLNYASCSVLIVPQTERP